MERMLSSSLSGKYDFVPMRQEKGTGGVDIALLCEWSHMLRDLRPDIVHVRGLGNEGFHGALAAKLARCPRILLSVHGTVRDIQAPETLRRLIIVNGLERATLMLATHIATVCRWGESRVFLDGVRSKMVGIVPNGVGISSTNSAAARTSVRHDLSIGEADVAVVSVGRLSLQKGHLILAEALRLLGGNVCGLVLIVVGDGPDSAEIQQAYRSVPGLRIRMLGTRTDVSTILCASDIFVFPTLHENMSNALLEAMAAGLPVIASDVGGNPEVLDGGGGELVPVRDAAALAEAIRSMAYDADRRSTAAAAGQRVVQERYSLDKMLNGWDQVYGRVLKGSR